MATLRIPESEEKYQEYLKTEKSSCPLCEKKPLQEFGFWNIVENSFPYDKIAATHHMLVLRRHAPQKELSAEELREIDAIRSSHIESTYEWIVEPTHKNKSIPSHAHLHLIIGK